MKSKVNVILSLVLDLDAVCREMSDIISIKQAVVNLFTVKQELNCMRNFSFQFLTIYLVSEPVAAMIRGYHAKRGTTANLTS
jgi:hypothetical protein